MANNKNKKSVKFQGDMLNFYDFIQVYKFTTNHHLKLKVYGKFINNLISSNMHLFLQIHCFFLRVVSCCYY